MNFRQEIWRLCLAVAAALPMSAGVANAQEPVQQCGIDADACLASCKRFSFGDSRLLTCQRMCANQADCGNASSASNVGALSDESVSRDALQGATTVGSHREVQTERQKNEAMQIAIRSGNLKNIRRLIEDKKLNPTYVYEYAYNARTKQFETIVAGLRLNQIFADVNTSRGDDKGLDKVLALFFEMGLDVNATLPTAADIRAWSPNLRFMESARDRDARLRTLELALQTGLKPNADFSEWLFAELPQVCGRDRSKFSIQVFDLLLKYLEPTLEQSLWRMGERGPETVADVLDRSIAPPQAKYEYQKEQFAKQDEIWAHCQVLSKRINKFLTQGQ